MEKERIERMNMLESRQSAEGLEASEREELRILQMEHLAEMMYLGSAMGITKITRHQKDYAGTNPKICDLAKRLLKTEENNMEQMRTFL